MILCVNKLYRYKGFLFEKQSYGAPFWPIKDDGTPYQRLAVLSRQALNEFIDLSETEQEEHILKGDRQ